MRVPLLDLRAQYAEIRGEVERRVLALFDEQQFVLGARVESFEKEIAAYCGSRFAVGVASGTDALLLALLALDVGPRDAVVTTPFTFFATAGSIARTGARIVFADVDPATLNLSVEATGAALEAAARGHRRVAVVPVHLYGRLAPVVEIRELAARVGAAVVEDAAQAIGARRQAEPAGSAGTFGDFGALSFFPSKNLGAAGDAGMVLTQDERHAERVRLLRVHGSRERYVHEEVGINSRLDAIQAEVLSVKLARLEAWNAKRRERAARYRAAFRAHGLGEAAPVVLPEEPGPEHVFHLYVVRAQRREELRAALAAAGVETQVYYPVPLHLQPCFAALGLREGAFPEAERASRECLALPIYPEIRDEQVEHVAATVARFYGGS